MSVRDDLIERGLLKPRTQDEEAKRNGILLRLAEGEKIKDAPNLCVFRSDEPYTHVILDGKHKCKSAELIEEKLSCYEAHVLCTRLNNTDEELPLRHEKSLYRQALYKICSMQEWNAWKDEKAQVSIFD